MILILGTLVALGLAVGIAMLLKSDPGYVLISVSGWTVETSFAVMLVFLGLLFIVCYLLARYLVRLYELPKVFRKANAERQKRGSRKKLAKGLAQLAEGRWADAEMNLAKGVAHSENPALHYAGAARAAQKLNADWRRDNYFKEARALPVSTHLTTGLAEAELMLEDREAEKAKSILFRLQLNHAHNPRLLELKMRAHQDLAEWDQLMLMLPELHKRKVIDDTAHRQLQEITYTGQLDNVARSGGLDDLHRFWKKLPRDLQADEDMVVRYAGHLQYNNAADEAEAMLRKQIGKQWSDKLVAVYGAIGRGDATTQLGHAERWIPGHEDDAQLLLTLGKISQRARQYGKSRDYLERSLAILPTPEAYQVLGEVFEEQDEPDRANRCYRAGLRILSGQPAEEPTMEVLPAPKPSAPEEPEANKSDSLKATTS